MITNEDYEKYKPMIYKIARKYKDNIYKLEVDDLMQIGAIGLINGFNTYDGNREMKLQNWIYSCIKRAILREFTDLKRIKRQIVSKTVSIDVPIGDSDEDITIEDTIEDTNINVLDEALENVIMEVYKGEVDLILNGLEHDIAYETLFTDKTLTEVSKSMNIEYSKAKHIQGKAYRELRYKSKLIRSKYMELKEIDTENNIINLYKDPSKVVYIREVSKELKEKYKHELDTIDTIQTIFDGLNLYAYNEFVQMFILSLEDVLEDKDIVIYKTTIEGNRASLNNKYSFSDIHFVEDRIKKQIVYNKLYVCELWDNYKTNRKNTTKWKVNTTFIKDKDYMQISVFG